MKFAKVLIADDGFQVLVVPMIHENVPCIELASMNKSKQGMCSTLIPIAQVMLDPRVVLDAIDLEDFEQVCQFVQDLPDEVILEGYAALREQERLANH